MDIPEQIEWIDKQIEKLKRNPAHGSQEIPDWVDAISALEDIRGTLKEMWE